MNQALPTIDMNSMLAFLKGLIEIPSPTGLTEASIAYTEKNLAEYPQLELSRTRKGALLATWPGQAADAPRGITAHVDTLGAMVKRIRPNGRLQLSKIGGFAWNTVENEGCHVFTRSGETLHGSLILTTPSAHVHGSKVNETRRLDETVELRLDLRTSSAAETEQAGIQVGDYVAFDPRFELNNGFVRARHLDDKACVANILGAVQAMSAAGLRPAQTTHILISNFEEVGHGGSSGFPPALVELLALDMAAVGDGQNSDEFHATICIKDSAGPYHHDFTSRLRDLAEGYAIAHKADIYPMYSSDGQAYWRAGGDVAVALIGPGIDASHNYERTHSDALLAATQWLIAYLLN
jgi:putative aminopeptidase FrvX